MGGGLDPGREARVTFFGRMKKSLGELCSSVSYSRAGARQSKLQQIVRTVSFCQRLYEVCTAGRFEVKLCQNRGIGGCDML